MPLWGLALVVRLRIVNGISLCTSSDDRKKLSLLTEPMMLADIPTGCPWGLSCQRELHGHAEVLCDGGVAAAGEQGC